MKLLTAFPVYHTVPAGLFTRYLGMDKSSVLGSIVVDGVYVEKAMQLIVDEALKIEGWDRLVIIEADTIPPPDVLERITGYDKDIVGSVYFMHDPPHNVMCYIQEENELRYNPLTPQTVKEWTDEPGLYKCDAVGFGFTSIARHVLENWDKDISMFEADRKEIDFGSHDLWFCHQARKQGFGVYIDSGVVCDHLTTVGINLDNNQASASLTKTADIIDFSYNTDKKKTTYQTTSHEIINAVPDLKNKSYLEIGTETGVTFDRIRAKQKVGVDPDKEARATHYMTSDEFFEQNTQKFDVIFIDGDHHATQVLKDFNNAVDALSENGVIFVHDLYPYTEEMGSPDKPTDGRPWCGDGYKMLDWANRHGVENHTLNENFGFTYFPNPQKLKLNAITYKVFRDNTKTISKQLLLQAVVSI